MRKADFRGKFIYADSSTGKLPWVYGTIQYIATQEDKAVIHTSYGQQEIILSTAGEYTGELDKNGQKIYEGDIVECCSWNEYFTDTSTGNFMEPFRRRMVVEFRNAGFKLVEKHFGQLQGLCDRIWDFITDQDLIVIGNIYDTPELISSEACNTP